MRFLAVFMMALFISACAEKPLEELNSDNKKGTKSNTSTASTSPENTLVIQLNNGRVLIKLRPDLAPNHVARVKKLAGEGFYDGIVFHRVIADFMAQTGDPTGTGTGGSKYPDVKAEFSSEPFVRGTVGAARAQNPDSANSQFFICFKSSRFLDGQYTVWGNVISGMEFVDMIKKGAPRSGTVNGPDKMIKVRLLSQLK